MAHVKEDKDGYSFGDEVINSELVISLLNSRKSTRSSKRNKRNL